MAIDLPGVGGSTGEATDGSTEAIAAVVHDLLGTLALENVTLVGHDLGGMTAYSYLRRFDDAARTVIMDTVVPGVAPWEQVLANPYVWHFAFHSIPGLPELLVKGKQREYFDFFFNVLSPEQSGVSSEARDGYTQAYASDEALRTGFNWYRMLRQDAADNASATGPIASPLLYLRGEHEGETSIPTSPASDKPGLLTCARRRSRAQGTSHPRTRPTPSGRPSPISSSRPDRPRGSVSYADPQVTLAAGYRRGSPLARRSAPRSLPAKLSRSHLGSTEVGAVPNHRLQPCGP